MTIMQMTNVECRMSVIFWAQLRWRDEAPRPEGNNKKKKLIERGIEEYKNIEERYDRLSLEVTELMRREEATMGMEITTMERDSDRMKLIIKQNEREIIDFENKIIKSNSD